LGDRTSGDLHQVVFGWEIFPSRYDVGANLKGSGERMVRQLPFSCFYLLHPDGHREIHIWFSGVFHMVLSIRALGALLLLTVNAGLLLGQAPKEGKQGGSAPTEATAILAGGCFWCVESSFEKCPGVINVVSGYSGGRAARPSYQTYAGGGHREVVMIVYDPTKVTYAGLVEFLIKHINPWDKAGSFVDRGRNYSPAIYFETPEEKKLAEQVIKAIDEMKVYKKAINVSILPRKPFWPAEDYHQDYHNTNTANYLTYRQNCGRDPFIKEHWGDKADELILPISFPSGKKPDSSENMPAGSDKPTAPGNDAKNTDKGDKSSDNANKPWLNFVKPTRQELKKKLSRSQFEVTQEKGTELPFSNSFWNHHEPGIYVDVVSGEPLFSSLDKFDSGTGWPSFVRPIEESCLVTDMDYTNGTQRIEVRSKMADSHLGHVFDDGPPQQGGLRFCINSASLRFIPVEQLEEAGYSEYAQRFRNAGAGRKR
jgi:peptide methionine sulfoxide reductase msrA/msrB